MLDTPIFDSKVLFFNTFDKYQRQFRSRREAYEASERDFEDVCDRIFGSKYRMYSCYESFVAAYNRHSNKILTESRLVESRYC